MKPRYLLLILLLLVLLFVLVLRLAAQSNGRSSQRWPQLDLNADGLNQLRDRLILPLERDAVVDGEPNDACLMQAGVLLVPEATRCRFMVRASSGATRRMKLLLVAGTAVVVELDQENALLAEETLPTAEGAASLDIFRHPDEQAAILTLYGCQGAASEADTEETVICQVEIQ